MIPELNVTQNTKVLFKKVRFQSFIIKVCKFGSENQIIPKVVNIANGKFIIELITNNICLNLYIFYFLSLYNLDLLT